MEPRQPGARKHVAKKVTVDYRVAKWGKYGLYNNMGCCFANLVGKRLTTTSGTTVSSTTI